MSPLADISGFLLIAGTLIYEVYAPRFLDRETTLSPILQDVPQQVEELKEDHEDMRGRVDCIDKSVQQVRTNQERLTDVTIAQSHLLNGHDGSMNVTAVEDRLRSDEESPDDYLKREEMEGHANWRDDSKGEGEA